MINDNTLRKPSVITRRTRALKRAVYWHMSAVLPIILAAEFPKSGGTWIAQMVASAAGYRFPRNLLPPHFWKTLLLGHYKSSPLYDRVFVIFRDGRDVMVSAYHHFLFENEWNDPRTADWARREINYGPEDEPYAKFDDFVEWMFTGYCKGVMRFSWAEFARSWIDKDVPKVFYERMLTEPVRELHQLCQALGISVGEQRIREIVYENSFAAQTGRKRGKAVQKDSSAFARKGIAGDWKNVFDKRSAEIFDHYAGAELIALGYEEDRSWFDLEENIGD